jgi:hypothetical protein
MDILSLKFETCDIDRITPYARIGRIAPHPVDLMMRPILGYTARWDYPFLVGTKWMAADLGGWAFLDKDCEPRCVDVTVCRGEHLTGRTATLDGDGPSFAEMPRVLRPALDRKGRAQ